MPKISCDNGFCIYQNKGTCILEQIQLDSNGICNECIHINIPEESLEHIYERFYRVDKSHSREIGGTGLGLAITKHLVEMLGGKIVVQSKYGQGSKFTVYLKQKIKACDPD